MNKTLEIVATAASESGEIVQTIEGSWMAGVFGCEALTIRPTGSGSIYEDSFVFVGDVVAEAAGRSFHAEFETTTPEADVIQLDFLDADFSNLARWSSTGGAPVDETVPDGAVYVLVASCTGLDGSTTITIG